MKSIHIFDIDRYHEALSPSPNRIPSYTRQKGGGIANVLARYSIPIVKKYVVPHAKKAAIGVYNDITSGKNIKTSLKRNAIGLIQDMSNHAFNSLKGEGVRMHRSTRALPTKRSTATKRKAPKPTTTKKSTKRRGKKKKTKLLSKRDIFS